MVGVVAMFWQPHVRPQRRPILLRMRNGGGLSAAPPTSHDTAKMSTQRAKLENELFIACQFGDIDRVRRVIAAGVDPKKKTINENYFRIEETPLHAACRYVI